jgi:hypothetical protein
LLKTEKESLYRNRTFSLATVRWIRNHAVEPLYIFKVKEWEKLSLPLDLMLLVSGKETQGFRGRQAPPKLDRLGFSRARPACKNFCLLTKYLLREKSTQLW